MKNKNIIIKFISVVTILLISLVFFNTKVYAAKFNLDVNCDGKKIEMTSKTPDMTWSINNMLPGQKEETTINISNVGPKSVKVEFKATTDSGEDVSNILNIQVIKIGNGSKQTEQIEYDGKYSEMNKIVLNLDSRKSQEYKIITALPADIGNEYQGKECQIKLEFTSTGESDEQINPPAQDKPEQEPEKQYISTSEIKSPQTGESNAIYIVAAILVFAFITLGLIYFIQKITK